MRDEHFQWDDQKSVTNKHKHGIDFDEARNLWKQGVIEFPSPARGQMRYVAFGELNGKLALVVLTYYGGIRRLISARYATADEMAKYEDAAKKIP